MTLFMLTPDLFEYNLISYIYNEAFPSYSDNALKCATRLLYVSRKYKYNPIQIIMKGFREDKSEVYRTS